MPRAHFSASNQHFGRNKSLGLVWIPGVMAGMLVSGASPVYAGIFQFIIVAMILSASGTHARSRELPPRCRTVDLISIFHGGESRLRCFAYVASC